MESLVKIERFVTYNLARRERKLKCISVHVFKVCFGIYRLCTLVHITLQNVCYHIYTHLKSKSTGDFSPNRRLIFTSYLLYRGQSQDNMC